MSEGARHRPCVCGGVPRLVPTKTGSFRVVCASCGVDSPAYFGEDRAWEIWNEMMAEVTPC